MLDKSEKLKPAYYYNFKESTESHNEKSALHNLFPNYDLYYNKDCVLAFM